MKKVISKPQTNPVVKSEPEPAVADEISAVVEISESEAIAEVQIVEDVKTESKNGTIEPSTLLVNRITRIKNEIASKEQALAKQKEVLARWSAEDAQKLKALDDKLQSDKVKAILQMNETGNLEAKKLMKKYFSDKMEQLELEISELEASGITGEFSPKFQEYLQEREARHQKQYQNLKKNYLDSTENKKTVQIPKLEEQIEQLRIELAEAEDVAK